jgi:hypothetical protein
MFADGNSEIGDSAGKQDLAPDADALLRANPSEFSLVFLEIIR